MCQELGIEEGNDAIPTIAFGFAGGIGNTGSVCGAVAGGVMAIALRLGRADSMERALQNLAVFSEFRRRFEEEMGAVDCRELTGLDLTDPENQQGLMDSDVPMKVCFPAVGAAYRLALEILNEREGG